MKTPRFYGSHNWASALSIDDSKIIWLFTEA